jgi:uncharacterized protein YaiI (UPF0178 family)
MTIWVDADAMPRAVKEVLYRAAQRRKVDIAVPSENPVRPHRA